MKTIETKPGVTLGFVKWDWHPAPTKVLVEGETDPRSIIYDGKSLNPYKADEVGQTSSQNNYKVIGKLSEITEEQAKELVEMTIDDAQYREVEKDGSVINRDHKYKLRKQAKSVGIEEKDFDKYLVIKL
jgi:hypothetical protein